MATAYGLSSCPSCLALESKLSRSLEVQYGLVPKLSHHGGKNHRADALKNQVSSAQDNGNKNLFNRRCLLFNNLVRSGFSVERSDTVFLPLMMFPVAKQHILQHFHCCLYKVRRQ